MDSMLFCARTEWQLGDDLGTYESPYPNSKADTPEQLRANWW